MLVCTPTCTIGCCREAPYLRRLLGVDSLVFSRALQCISPKHWYLQHFCSLYNILRKDVEQDALSQASMYNILRKDVEQNKLSQASMLLASMPKSLVFTAILPLCTTYCARSAFLLCKAPAAKETYQTFKIERVRAAPLEADGITCSDLGESEVQGFRRGLGGVYGL